MIKIATILTEQKPQKWFIPKESGKKFFGVSFYLSFCMTLVLLCGCDSSGYQNPKDLHSVPYRPLARLMPEENPQSHPPSASAQPQPPTAWKMSESETQSHEGKMIHKVRSGESLFAISRMYYGDDRYWRLIFERNHELLQRQTKVQAGQVLYMPLAPRKDIPPAIRKSLHQPDFYVIAPGDRLGQIADWLLGDSSLWPQLIERNKNLIKNSDEIQPGMILRIREDLQS